MSTKKVLRTTNCIDCPLHSVLPDPDPDDWFNDDDMKVVCNLAKKEITSACRPYNLRKESDIPNWCPLTDDDHKCFTSEKGKQFFAIPFIDLTKPTNHDQN